MKRLSAWGALRLWSESDENAWKGRTWGDRHILLPGLVGKRTGMEEVLRL